MTLRLSPFATTFVRQAGATYATRLASVIIGLATAVAVARALGPEGRGAFSAAMAISALGIQIATLGLSTSNTYYAARDHAQVRQLIGNSLAASGTLGLAIILIFIGIRWGFGAFDDLNGLLLVGALAWIPIGLCYLLSTSILFGIRQIYLLNVAELSLRATTLGLIAIAIFIFNEHSPEGLFSVALVVQSLVAIAVLLKLSQISRGIRVSLSLFLSQIPYALKSYLALLFAFILLKIDLLMVQDISGNAEAGQYSIAVSISEVVFILPATLGQILFPHLAGDPDPRNRLRATLRMIWHAGWILAAITVAIWVVVPFAIPILFGESFSPSVPMLRVLLVAVYFLGLNTFLSNYFMAEGLPWPAIWIWVVAAGINVALNAVWIPTFGGIGAAYASLVAYMVVTVLQGALVFVRKRHGD